ncbi:hypothetical protein BUALT_Bualt05G0151000 [Buddleja alternifolia]|uniref:alpha-amylase n=1 Tax=Buddleja alternifolia TaxID=168488 RepID=A0AAV6XLC0_9LAMI|nr:hypothetical protein BUALT_Bualt05G0151000 [Buddleja alternifolia]
MAGALGINSNTLLKPETAESKGDDIGELSLLKRPLQGFYEEHSVVKETVANNSVSVSVTQCLEKAKNVLYIETDLPGDVVVHWGVCRDESQNWEIPGEPYPPETKKFKNKALRTLLQQKNNEHGSRGSFTLDEVFLGFVFVLKLNENSWLNCNGKDFYIPLSSSVAPAKQIDTPLISGNASESNEAVSAHTGEIINEIRNLISGISSEKIRKTKSREAHQIILQEIEKLAAEAYSIFRSSTPTFIETDLQDEELEAFLKISLGTSSGFEILCQGFNWESHKSGNWYTELHEKASTLSSLGFTVIWLPPPTESVSPEGYMPGDLYNLNSRYGNIDQLKALVTRLHEVGIRALGDVVLNHRCAQYQNQNGVWNIFGGRLNWDDRAIVADDPHFQGRGNKSSGDNFHAAPNIDHSQEFVRNDIKEWLRWLREEIGYDGWRLDFVRGFWGGYVKEYLDSSEPYFVVGEYWDSLSYTYGEMDYNQDAHRQRIVDWINAAGSAGAFDVTTKGILHSVLDRCEYWRLLDEKGKPPGVLGWWPSRAVTFIENHDTGSTQGHWRFPGGKEMQGYAYILTHPGTPSVFYDHIFSDYQSQIAELISVRKRNMINCRSKVRIMKAERDVYAAMIDETVAMKIGPGHYEPSNGPQNWSLALEGNDYKTPNTHSNGATLCSRYFQPPKALSSAIVETSESSIITFGETFQLKRTEKVEGKITIKLESVNEDHWQLTVGCSLPGKWILHWGVNYIGDVGSEWDQPPLDMKPPDSISIKDYAIETPLQRTSASLEGEAFYEVTIDFNTKCSIAAINFVLKDEESGNWYQHRGRDFKVPLVDLQDDDNVVGANKGSGMLPVKNSSLMAGALGINSNTLLKPEAAESKGEDIGELSLLKRPLQGFYEEHSVVKETVANNSVSVSVTHCLEKAKNVLYIETDLPGDVVVHWGVCRDESQNWEIPGEPYPPETKTFKNKALRTLLQQKNNEHGSRGSFTLDEMFLGFVFVLKLNENSWLNCSGKDFYIPLSSSVAPAKQIDIPLISGNASESNEAVSAHTEEIINEIRNLVSGISSEKIRKTKSREAHQIILQEIEKLAAEAYSIFSSSTTTFIETDLQDEALEAFLKISLGTSSGFEILCQGFNWESHKSGNWYNELHEKTSILSSLGFTVIWLPPPTESVSPEGYMPGDLYNLNSRYGNIDQLKVLVTRLHEVGIRALGDVVLNHRCAQYQNQNGVWNIFGGRLNWDDRAIVADDPHFQGRGNKSSGDNFHAAPNIDHSQEFVRNDIKEWLRWLREAIGYDGWRLDFVRGFWGGYVKDYLDSSDPYLVVGEYWDSLSYTYGEMDYNQDAHRQRIVNWINAAGSAGAFDVTTKGILHSVLDRCEYWRLSDEKGKPPGVVGWWPSRAVTFIENHDTGSTQGHWRFPGGKEMQGYAYILTHPGNPSVFYDHIFSHYQSQIAELISVRKRNMINCRSKIRIMKAERDVYAAMIDERVAMKIGPGHYEPSNGPQNWSLAVKGNDYKVWEASSN